MALGIEGTHAWNVAIVSNLGSTTVNSPVFKSEEGMWRSEALLDQAAVTDGNSVGLGVVEDIDSTSIKLTLPILYQMGIHAGLAIHGPLGVINGTVVSFTADTLVMSAPPTNLSVGDFVKAVYPPKSSGNRVKGYYFSARFTLPTADRAKESEVYAVNLDYNANYPNQADSGRSK